MKNLGTYKGYQVYKFPDGHFEGWTKRLRKVTTALTFEEFKKQIDYSKKRKSKVKEINPYENENQSMLFPAKDVLI